MIGILSKLAEHSFRCSRTGGAQPFGSIVGCVQDGLPELNRR